MPRSEAPGWQDCRHSRDEPPWSLYRCRRRCARVSRILLIKSWLVLLVVHFFGSTSKDQPEQTRTNPLAKSSQGVFLTCRNGNRYSLEKQSDFDLSDSDSTFCLVLPTDDFCFEGAPLPKGLSIPDLVATAAARLDWGVCPTQQQLWIYFLWCVEEQLCLLLIPCHTRMHYPQIEAARVEFSGELMVSCVA